MRHPAQPDPAAQTPPTTTPPTMTLSATTPPATAPSGGGGLRDRGSGFRPYPTASTSTRLSPASPASRAASSRRRSRVGTPIPATVWVPEPGHVVDPAAVWPTVILRQIVAAFSQTGDEVVLTPWPSDTGATPVDHRTRTAEVTQDRPVRAAADRDLDTALDTVARLLRCPRVIELGLGRAIGASTPEPMEIPPADDTAGLSRGGTAELVVTSMPPNPTAALHTDAVALHAARELRFGGILVVLTHCHLDGGVLRDPTGPMIAAAQNADLLYLQHIVAVHLPVHDLRVATGSDPTAAPDGSGSVGTGTGSGSGSDVAGHCRTGAQPAHPGSAQPDACRRAEHRRVHSDVLAFAQPHEHRSPEPAERDEIPF